MTYRNLSFKFNYTYLYNEIKNDYFDDRNNFRYRLNNINNSHNKLESIVIEKIKDHFNDDLLFENSNCFMRSAECFENNGCPVNNFYDGYADFNGHYNRNYPVAELYCMLNVSAELDIYRSRKADFNESMRYVYDNLFDLYNGNDLYMFFDNNNNAKFNLEIWSS